MVSIRDAACACSAVTPFRALKPTTNDVTAARAHALPMAHSQVVTVGAVASTDDLQALQRECRRAYVDPALIQYAVRLVAATRTPERYGLKDMGRYLTFGASPRASINLIEGARALAFLRGRSYVWPEDVVDLVPDVLRHRLVLSYEALSDQLSADQIIQRIMQQLPAPEKPLESHVKVG